MTSEVQIPFGFEMGEQELQELVTAGDDNAWSLDDWSWDHKAFTAKPQPHSSASCRANKRHCSGLGSTDTAGPFLQMLQKPCCAPAKAENTLRQADPHINSSIASQDKASKLLSLEAKSTPLCQVETCGKELSHLSTYHQRCHICEVQIKEQQFMRAGKLQRFCQQCGRCHELSAFQGPKRSCREQLAKHNARRRRRHKKEEDQGSVEGSGPCQASEGLAAALASLEAHWMDDLQPQQEYGLPGSDVPLLPQPDEHANPLMQQEHAGQAGGLLPLFAFEAPQAAAFGAVQAEKPLNSFIPDHSQAPAEGSSGTTHENSGDSTSSGRQPCIAPQPGQSPMALAAAAIAESRRQENTRQHVPYNFSREMPGHETFQEESSFQTALRMMSEPHESSLRPHYQSDNVIMRLSVKLFDCTPASLPPNLKEQLTGWLQCTPMGVEGYLRPGCVHLLMQAAIPAQEAARIEAGGIRAVAAYLQAQEEPLWREHVHLLELNGEFALVKNEHIISVFGAPAAAPPDHILLQEGHAETPCIVEECASCSEESKLLPAPQLVAVSPSAAFLGFRGPGLAVELRGKGITGCRSKLLCRSGGVYLPSEPFSNEPAFWISGTREENGEEIVEVRISSSTPPGLLAFEVQTGCLLSEPKHVLLCPSAELAVELSSLPANPSLQDLTQDLSLVLGPFSSGGEEEAISSLAGRLADNACRRDMPEMLSCILEKHLQLHQPALMMPLLQICIQHDSTSALEALLRTQSLAASLMGPKGITPLHLAAMSQKSTASAHLIASYCGASQWIECTTHDGLSPSDFAVMAGNVSLDAQMKACICQSRPQLCPTDCQPIPGVSETGREHGGLDLLEKCGSPANSSSSKDTAICVDFGRSGRGKMLAEWSDDDSSESDCDCR